MCGLQVNETFSSYCYDVVYSSYSSDAHLLMTASMTEVTSRVCCVIAKTGRAVADFAVMHEPPDPSVHSSSHNLTFSLHCFHDETFNGISLCVSPCLSAALCVFGWG